MTPEPAQLVLGHHLTVHTDVGDKGATNPGGTVAAKNVVDRLVRAWSILTKMQARRGGITPMALQTELGISRATLYRELKVLEFSPLPIRKETVNGETRYLLDATAFALPKPSPDQVLAFAIARRLLTPFEGTRIVETIDAYLKLCPTPVELPLYSDEGEPTHDPAHARMIERAIDQQRALRITYGRSDGSVSSRDIEPLQLRENASQLYLAAWDLQRNDWRVFKVARIEEVIITDAPATMHPPFDPKVVFAHSIGVWTGPAQRVKIRIVADKAHLLEEYALSSTMETSRNADGSVDLTATVAGLTEALQWTLRWGSAAEVLEPREFRTMMQAELARAMSRYGR